MFETLAVALIFLSALLVMGARVYRNLRQATAAPTEGQGGCGGCTGCACPSTEKEETTF